MGIDDLTLTAYQRVEALADQAACKELRWVSAVEACAALAVTLGVPPEEFLDFAKTAIHRARRDFEGIKRMAMKQMAANTTKRRTT